MTCHLLLSFLVILHSVIVFTKQLDAVPDFDQNYVITWGESHVSIINQGHDVQLSMDSSSGAGFGSKLNYYSGLFSMKIKVPDRNSAGVVTAFYVTMAFKALLLIAFFFYVLHEDLVSMGLTAGEHKEAFKGNGTHRLHPPIYQYHPRPPFGVYNPRTTVDCAALCSVRCSKSSRHKMCIRACGTCCQRCNCVPPGTSGRQEACGSCYAKMTTHNNRLKCP